MKKIFLWFSQKILAPLGERFFIEKIIGKENFPQKGGFIVASNHQSGWDHYWIGCALKKRLQDVHFIGALDSFKIFLITGGGLLYYLSDTIIINRKDKEKKKKALKKAVEYLKKGKIVVIYPEGDTNKKNYLLRGKVGVALLAKESSVPVVPLGIKKEKKVILKVGKPLFFDQKKDSLESFTSKVMKEISKLCQKPYLF